MNSGPPPVRPEDEASDPLLSALRQRLGDYGQAPPPGAWAAIRQQLAPPPVRPWWQRPRRLLPLLGLLLGLVLVGTLATHRRLASLTTPTRQPQKPTASLAESFATTSTSSASRPDQKRTSVTTLPDADNFIPDVSTREPFTKPALITEHRSNKQHQPAASPLSHLVTDTSAEAQLATSSTVAVTGTQRRARRSRSPKPGANQLELTNTGPVYQTRRQHMQHLAALRASYKPRTKRWPASRFPVPHSFSHGPASAVLAAGQGQIRSHLSVAIKHTPAPQRQGLAGQASARMHLLTTSHHVFNRRTTVAAHATRHQREPRASEQAYGIRALFTRLAPTDTRVHLDSLAQRLAQLELAATLPLPAVTARPDSTPAAVLVRHWSLLVLGGPTLSYRTLGSIPPTIPSPDFARLERPAVGVGAQVQLRRVLSGRWALAVGLGYHEYATRLNLQLADSAARQLQLRDTYRLLTLPLQATYALGVPHGRLARALLVGTEVGWYQGGRSTEGSTCSCQQQGYSSAAGSPFRPWSLAFTLGLDLRYQLGSAAGRWHWVVQPTGRYVLSPFVRSEALGYTHRQPFSLGLLTGFSWDLR